MDWRADFIGCDLSGMRNDLMIPGIDRNGERVPTLEVTGVEESAELPKEFALHGQLFQFA